MNISVNYDETDVVKLLSQIIVHPNAEEFVKLLAYQVGTSNAATNHLFKLHLGHKLYDPLPNGTLCYIHYKHLTYNANIEDMKNEGIIDEDGLVIVQVKHFRGYHENSNYTLSFDNMVNGKREVNPTWCNHDQLTIIEEF